MKRIIFGVCVLLILLRGSVFAQKTKRTVQLPDKIPTVYSAKTGWTMLWHDEFDADSIDYHAWWPQERAEPATLCYLTSRRENVHTENGNLLIINKKENYKDFQYTGAVVFSSRQIEANTRVEVRMKTPKGKSLWPCFWLWSGADSTYQEVDVAEFAGSKPNEFNASNHYWDAAEKKVKIEWRKVRFQNSEALSLDLTADYHQIAIEWLPNRLAYYIDNVLFYEITNNIPTHPMNLILSMGTGGADGKPNKKTIFPAVLSIDYVRVYQLNK